MGAIANLQDARDGRIPTFFANRQRVPVAIRAVSHKPALRNLWNDVLELSADRTSGVVFFAVSNTMTRILDADSSVTER